MKSAKQSINSKIQMVTSSVLLFSCGCERLVNIIMRFESNFWVLGNMIFFKFRKGTLFNRNAREVQTRSKTCWNTTKRLCPKQIHHYASTHHEICSNLTLEPSQLFMVVLNFSLKSLREFTVRKFFNFFDSLGTRLIQVLDILCKLKAVSGIWWYMINDTCSMKIWGKSSPVLFFFVAKNTMPKKSLSLPYILCKYMFRTALIYFVNSS